MHVIGRCGGASLTTTSRSLVLNLDSMGDRVLTRHYLRFEIGLWVLDLLIRLGPVRAEAGVQIKHGHLAVDVGLRLIWSHR